VTKGEADDPRDRLRHLMRRGLGGRNLKGAWRDLNVRLMRQRSETVAFDTFCNWYEGLTFPKTRLFQNALGDVVGHDEGEAIRAIADPPFRHYRHGCSRPPEPGPDKMSHHGLKKVRTFPLEPLRDGGGRTVMHATIICVQCGTREHHLQRGSVNATEFFEKAGWQVGTKPEGDKCPLCRKVIVMKEHRKETPAVEPVAAPTTEAPPRQMTGSERTIIARYVIDNFDEPLNQYMTGWSDSRIARELDVPCPWVRDERLHFFKDSIGEDPNIDLYLDKLRGLEARLPDMDSAEQSLYTTVAKIDQHLKGIEEEQRKLRLEVNKFSQDRAWLRAEVAHMKDIETTLPPPFDQKKTG